MIRSQETVQIPVQFDIVDTAEFQALVSAIGAANEKLSGIVRSTASSNASAEKAYREELKKTMAESSSAASLEKQRQAEMQKAIGETMSMSKAASALEKQRAQEIAASYRQQVSDIKTSLKEVDYALRENRMNYEQASKAIDGIKTSIAAANLKYKDQVDLNASVYQVQERASVGFRTLGRSVQETTHAVNTGTNVQMQFNRILQDLPFGLMGIANNITATTEAWSYYSKGAEEAGVKTSFVKTVLAGITTPIGMVSLVSSVLLLAGNFEHLKKMVIDTYNSLFGVNKEMDALNRKIKENKSLTQLGVTSPYSKLQQKVSTALGGSTTTTEEEVNQAQEATRAASAQVQKYFDELEAAYKKELSKPRKFGQKKIRQIGQEELTNAIDVGITAQYGSDDYQKEIDNLYKSLQQSNSLPMSKRRFEELAYSIRYLGMIADDTKTKLDNFYGNIDKQESYTKEKKTKKKKADYYTESDWMNMSQLEQLDYTTMEGVQSLGRSGQLLFQPNFVLQQQLAKQELGRLIGEQNLNIEVPIKPVFKNEWQTELQYMLKENLQNAFSSGIDAFSMRFSTAIMTGSNFMKIKFGDVAAQFGASLLSSILSAFAKAAAGNIFKGLGSLLGIPFLGDLGTAIIGKNASGNTNFTGGYTELAERGAELVTYPQVRKLPQGTRIDNAANTSDILTKYMTTANAANSSSNKDVIDAIYSLGGSIESMNTSLRLTSGAGDVLAKTTNKANAVLARLKGGL